MHVPPTRQRLWGRSCSAHAPCTACFGSSMFVFWTPPVMAARLHTSLRCVEDVTSVDLPSMPDEPMVWRVCARTDSIAQSQSTDIGLCESNRSQSPDSPTRAIAVVSTIMHATTHGEACPRDDVVRAQGWSEGRCGYVCVGWQRWVNTLIRPSRLGLAPGGRLRFVRG